MLWDEIPRRWRAQQRHSGPEKFKMDKKMNLRWRLVWFRMYWQDTLVWREMHADVNCSKHIGVLLTVQEVSATDFQNSSIVKHLSTYYVKSTNESNKVKHKETWSHWHAWGSPFGALTLCTEKRTLFGSLIICRNTDRQCHLVLSSSGRFVVCLPLQ